VTAAFQHLERRNLEGGRSLLEKGLTPARIDPPSYEGVGVISICEQILVRRSHKYDSKNDADSAVRASD
jgi:hypothetical protein